MAAEHTGLLSLVVPHGAGNMQGLLLASLLLTALSQVRSLSSLLPFRRPQQLFLQVECRKRRWEKRRANSLWNYFMKNREPFSSANNVPFQFISFRKEVENTSAFQGMALNPTFDMSEQLPNFNNTYIFSLLEL